MACSTKSPSRDGGNVDVDVAPRDGGTSREQPADAGSSEDGACAVETGLCGGCLDDDDCEGPNLPYCDVAAGVCIACRTDRDCAESSEGASCVVGRCSCASNDDCLGPHVWGRVCNTIWQRCACESDLDCEGSGNGPSCKSSNKCACNSDADCTATPYTLCTMSFAGAQRSCERPCASATDCVGRLGLPACDSERGACVACLTDAVCDKEPFATTCSPAHGCVECRDNADCGPESLGAICNPDVRVCTCASNADCVDRAAGQRCDETFHSCGCASDDDCAPPMSCSGSFAGLRICR